MRGKFKIVIISFALIIGAVLLSGCHTAAGFGKDIEKGGEAIQRAANRI